MMEREGLSLATRKGQRCKEEERFSGAIVSYQGMSIVRGWEWLSRAVGCCHKRVEVGRGGGIVASCCGLIEGRRNRWERRGDLGLSWASGNW
jgi:hypothetical protein